MIRSFLFFGTLSCMAVQPLSAQDVTLVRDFYPGSFGAYTLSGNPQGFRGHNGKLLLFATENMAVKLWAMDGIGGNFEELAAVGGPAGYTTTNGGIITSGDNIYFFAQQAGSVNQLLWCVRPGQPAVQLATLPYSILFGFTGIPLPGGKLLFPGHDADHGFELWITDGTTGGTQRLKDINPGTGTSFGSPFPMFQGFDFNGKAYFLASDGTNGPQLWESDGTEAGTRQFAAINPASASGAITLLWSKNSERFVVTANTGLIASDGTAAGTSVIHPGDHAMAHIPGLNYHTADNGWMYFSALESGDWKLYRTQGTEAGTQLVLDDVVPNQGYPYLTELNGMLYVFGSNDDGNVVLLRIDPATHEVAPVKTFLPGSGQSFNGITNFYGFRNDGQHFYFMGREGDHARQYWKSDGTAAGTAMVHEFLPTLVNGGPDAANGNMVVYQGRFLFAANDETVGTELWMAGDAVGVQEHAATGPDVRAWSPMPGNLTVQALTGQVNEVRVLDAAGRVLAVSTGLRTEQLTMPVDAHGLLLLDVRTSMGRSVMRAMMP